MKRFFICSGFVLAILFTMVSALCVFCLDQHQRREALHHSYKVWKEEHPSTSTTFEQYCRMKQYDTLPGETNFSLF